MRPWATNDLAVTFAETPVIIPVLSNDSAGAPLDSTPVTPPVNGTVTLDPTTRRATYTPAAGFTGVDTFEYRICSPTVPTLCDTALVTVLVITLNLPPTVDPLLLTTTTDVPVTGALVTSDPNASDVLTTVPRPPAPERRPRSSSRPGRRRTSHVPGFAGRDYYGAIVCDDGIPVLCATGRVSVEVLPVALPDTATTRAGTAVDIDIASNDRGAGGTCHGDHRARARCGHGRRGDGHVRAGARLRRDGHVRVHDLRCRRSRSVRDDHGDRHRDSGAATGPDPLAGPDA